MAENIVRISHQQNKPIKVLKWKVREGSTVSIGRILFLYNFSEDDKGVQQKLKCTKAGTIRKILAPEDAIIRLGDPLYELKLCNHPTIMNDMCAECGADLRKDDIAAVASVPMVHAIPDLKVSEEQAKIIGLADSQRLLRDRKLVLLVDLDQTLIHTTNDNIPPNIKDVYHFQLYGPQSPWYHTRLRPGTHQFLQNIFSEFELHICTFGTRNYAHMIAMFLDGDQKFFSNRILSRDECFDPTSKKANLKALFPCGDNMVCIIDDREDVWSNALNLIHVKPYHFFRHTGDINAPPGLDKHEEDEVSGVDLTNIKAKRNGDRKVNGLRKKTNVNIELAPENGELLKEMKDSALETKINQQQDVKKDNVTKKKDSKNIKEDNIEDKEENMKMEVDCDDKIENRKHHSDENRELDESLKSTKNIEMQSIKDEEKTLCNGGNDGMKENKKDISEEENVLDEGGRLQKSEDIIKENETGKEEIDVTNDEKHKILNDDIDKKDDTVGKKHNDMIIKKETDLTERKKIDEKKEIDAKEDKESDKMEKKDNDLLEVEDSDSYLLYLESILKQIHKAFYEKYDAMESGEVPDLKQVIPAVRSNVLKGAKLCFSGLVPTHLKLEQSKAYLIAKSLGAEVTQDLEENTTHLVAVRPGTAKVNSGKRRKALKIVTPDWLWCCAERWEHVEERIFPLNSKGSKNRHPPPHCSSPEHVPEYPVHSNPAARKRTPSGRFMDTINPLMSFSSADIADMDKEVEDILDDESESSDDEVQISKNESSIVLADESSNSSTSSSSGESLNTDYPHGYKRNHDEMTAGDLEDEVNNSEEEELPSTKFRRGESLEEMEEWESQDTENSLDAPDEVDDGEWNMMGAALEREFLSND